MADNKGRILFLEHYLTDYADEQHPVTTEALIAALEEKGYSANRNTIHSDLEALRAEGAQVASVRVGNAKGYYVRNRRFRIPELKALIDAVSSSQFISPRNSSTMIRHLAELAPEMHRKDLVATAFCADRIKTDSPAAFAALDTVHKAIRKYQKISFQYVDYLPDKEEILRHGKKKYVVSPYALLWNDGRYYVPSYDPEKDRIISYRVDRMRNVMPVKERADRRLPFNPAEYSKRVLWMYDGDLEETDVILTAENRHLISLMDRFGPEIPVAQADGEHIRATVRVIPSNTFFSWVFQFGGGIRVAGPAEVKEEYEEMLRKVLAQQGETGEKKHEISG